MKKILTNLFLLVVSGQVIAQSNTTTPTHPSAIEPLEAPIAGIIFPILFVTFLVFMLISLVKYFLEYRLKDKLIDRGMSEQLSAYLLNNNDQEKRNATARLAILFCGIGAGLAVTHLTAPIHLHSLAIMAFSIGLSYLAYFIYLRRTSS